MLLSRAEVALGKLRYNHISDQEIALPVMVDVVFVVGRAEGFSILADQSVTLRILLPWSIFRIGDLRDIYLNADAKR